MGLDHDIHHSTHSLVEFFFAFVSDGLMLLINWEIMEVVPERMTGRALGFTTVCIPGGLGISLRHTLLYFLI